MARGREIVGTNEDTIMRYLDEIDNEMDDFKESYVSKDWKDIPEFYLGKSHWGTYRPDHKLSPVLNFLQQAIEKKTSMMTDNKPFMDILPFSDSLQDVADALVDIIAAKWSAHSLDMTLTDIVFYAELFGSCGTNTLFDRSLRHGRGDITVQCVDPRNINFDPMVTAAQKLKDGEYVRIEQIQPTSLLKQMYPNKAKDIKNDAPLELARTRQRGVLGKTVRRLTSLSKKGAIKRSLVREYWLKDRTSGRGGPKYPGGRQIIVAGGALVQDNKNPYWDGMFPQDLLDWHRHPDSAWGRGDITNLIELQKLLNKLIALIAENAMLMTNAIWIGDSTALEPTQWDDLDNVPGLKVKKRPGTELKREAAPPLPQTMFSVIQYVEQAIEKLSGNTEVVQGKSPGEVKSGVAIEALQTAAMGVIRLKSRALESMLERIGEKVISRIFQFETSDQLMWRVGDKDEYIKFKFAKKLMREKFKDKKDGWKEFLFKIRPGSSMSMNDWQKNMMALQMYQAQPKPLLDRQAVLETMDWPGRTDIIARMEAEEQAMMKANLEAQMMLKNEDGLMAQGGSVGGAGLSGGNGSGGSAPNPTNMASPHAQQASTESVTKGGGGI